MSMFAIVALVFIVIGWPVFLDHRQKMAKLRNQNNQNSAPDSQLLARIEVLEKKCEKLQEQVNEAHMLIHDEQRALDRKLLEKIEAK